jgi:hypothetical protein
MYALKIALDICSLIAAFGSVLLFALPYLRYRYAILKHFILLQAAFSFYFLNDLVRVI